MLHCATGNSSCFRLPPSLVPRLCRRKGMATSNCYFRCQRVGRTIRYQNAVIGHSKPNCVMHWNVAVTPIHHNSRSFYRTSVGALHDDLCSFVVCLPSIAEPAANSCYHEQDRLVEISSMLEWGMQLPWPYICIQFELVEVARTFLTNGLGMRQGPLPALLLCESVESRNKVIM